MEPASLNIPGLKENSKGRGPRDNVRCPLGCKTVGYDSTTRYHEHLRKTHNFTKQLMESISHLVRKNGHLSLGGKWRKTYPMVSQQTTIPQKAIVPPPYIHSPDEYKLASRNPHQAVLERIKGDIRDGTIPAPTEWWFSLSNEEMDDHLRVSLRIFPSFLDAVDEEGLYQSRPCVVPTNQYADLFDEGNPNPGVWAMPN